MEPKKLTYPIYTFNKKENRIFKVLNEDIFLYIKGNSRLGNQEHCHTVKWVVEQQRITKNKFDKKLAEVEVEIFEKSKASRFYKYSSSEYFKILSRNKMIQYVWLNDTFCAVDIDAYITVVRSKFQIDEVLAHGKKITAAQFKKFEKKVLDTIYKKTKPAKTDSLGYPV